MDVPNCNFGDLRPKIPNWNYDAENDVILILFILSFVLLVT